MASSQRPIISPYRVVGNLVITSGVVERTGDTPTQIRGCMEKLKQNLAKAGASFDTVIKMTIYLADLSDREKYLNDIWREYFPVNPPCRTTVEAGLGPDTRVEIEAIAYKKQ